MPKPLDPDKRDAILADIRANRKTRNAIARDHGVSGSAVTRLAKTEGIETDWHRAQTEKATESRAADNAARHAELASDLLNDLGFYRQLARARAVEAVTGQTTGLGEAQRAATIFGIFTDKYKLLRQLDNPSGVDEGRALIAEMVEAMRGD